MDLNKFIVKNITKDDTKGVKIVELDNGQLLHLKQSWYNSIIEVGDCIALKIHNSNVNPQSSSNQQINQMVTTIDDTTTNFIVLNPDYLVTSTDLSSVSFCLRKTWLNSRFKFYGEHNRATLLGTLIHSLFQDTISELNLTSQFLENKFKQSIKEPWVLRSLVAIDLEEQDLINDSKNYINSIIQFNKKFSSNQFAKFNDGQPNLKLKINEITDIEDLILSPNYGLKGKIDLTVDTELSERDKIRKQKSTPFELKTGKVSFSFAHQAQISLYTIMIDNSTNQCNFGILAYLKDELNLKCVTVNHYIRNGLLMQRNELVHFLKYLEYGPETQTNLSFCSSCEHLLDCVLLAKIYEPEKLHNFETYKPELITNTLYHLNQKQIDFFKYWINLIYSEEKSNTRSLKDSIFFWDKTDAYEVEKNERKALAKLELEVDLNDDDLPYEFVFKRATTCRDKLGDLPTDLRFSKCNERITLSIENQMGQFEKIGFLNGVIKDIDQNFVTVLLDEKINKKYFKKIFRLDVLPNTTNYSFFYTSILRLMSSSSTENEINSERLRKLIIDKEKPKFNQQLLSADELELINASTKHLNICQQKAVLKSFEMNDYLLIHAYPGCGKMEFILSFLKTLSYLNKTVIITARTNQAVDHILLKLKEHGINFMRIGSLSRIHSNLIIYSEDFLVNKCKSTQDIKNLYSSINIFAGTCFAFSSHLIFSIQSIEYCIFDQATQACFPENLMPILNSQKFILIGNPLFISSSSSNQSAINQTLFEILNNKNDENSDNYVELTIQYRMNKEIMRFANFCAYDYKFTSGDDKIANSTLELTDNRFDKNENWVNYCLSNELDLSVLFIDYDNDSQFESEIFKKIIDQLISRKVSSNEIALISLYNNNNQFELLESSISSKDIEICANDQLLDQNKDVILISCFKNFETNNDEILNGKKRFNLILTRAKKKLILIGNRTKLNYEPFTKIFSYLNDNQIIKI